MQKTINAVNVSNFAACPRHLYDKKAQKSCPDCNTKQPEASKYVKRGVLMTTIMGVTAATFLCMKRHKFDIGTTKGLINGLKNLEYEKEVVPMIAAGSIAGGLLGGAIFDEKKNMKAKFREAGIQMLANVLIPLACVDKGSKLFKTFVKKPAMHKLNLTDTGIRASKKGRVIAGLFDIAALVTSLGAAIGVGNKVSNLINEKIYNIRDDRNVKVADLSGHVDDTCLALTASFDKTSPIAGVSSKVSRIIPLALLVCGYSSGVMQEWPDDLKAQRKVNPNKPQL